MPFCTDTKLDSVFRGKTVAIVGSGPGVLDNAPGFVDSHDVVVRVNNHKCSAAAGYRTDVHYSFYGSSIRKTAEELISEGVELCICKCPNSKPIESEWHRTKGKMNGVDFRYIYRARAGWWFCDTYVPTDEEFMRKFHLLGGHIPTTGFSAVLDVLRFDPESLYLTGFDFFASRLHNVDEPWRAGKADDPIGHVPDVERAWLATVRGVKFDNALAGVIQ